MTVLRGQVHYDQLLHDNNLLVKAAGEVAVRSVKEEAARPDRVRRVARRNLLRWTYPQPPRADGSTDRP